MEENEKTPIEETSVQEVSEAHYMSGSIQYIDSREVAKMVGKNHRDLLRDIRRYCKQMDEINQRNLALVDFFMESAYIDDKGERRTCYLVTMKGCEFIAHKLTGQKGTEFTAKYINRFHEMQDELASGKGSVDILADAVKGYMLYQEKRNEEQSKFNQQLVEHMAQLIQSLKPEVDHQSKIPKLKRMEIEYLDNSKWICVKEQVLGSLSRVLAKELVCSQNEAIGLIVRLWMMVANYADDAGFIKSMRREDVESSLNIGKSSEYSCEKAVEILVDLGWIEMSDGLKASDWAYWQDVLIKSIKTKQNNAERKRAERKRKRM